MNNEEYLATLIAESEQLTNDEIITLLDDSRTEHVEEIFRGTIKLTVKYLYKYGCRNADEVLESLGECYNRLRLACVAYKPNMKAKFSTYHAYTIRTVLAHRRSAEGAEKRRSTKDAISLNTPLGRADDVTLQDTIPYIEQDQNIGLPYNYNDIWQNALQSKTMTDRDRRVINSLLKGKTLVMIAEDEDVSKQYIHILKHRIIDKMSRYIQFHHRDDL